MAILPLLFLSSLISSSQSDVEIRPGRLLRTPTVHGDTLVFSHAGDLWVARTNSSAPARRLTSHPGMEIRPRISLDGKWIAFSGSMTGPRQVYVIPIEGGEPRRVTYGELDEAVGWTPDGRIAYRSSEGNWQFYPGRLWLVDKNGGLPEWTPLAEMGELSYLPDGQTIAYARNFIQDVVEIRGYRGGSQGRISFYDFRNNRYRELPRRDESQHCPMVIGPWLYYVSDRNGGVLNLYRSDFGGGKRVQLTHHWDSDIRFATTDGKSIVWERGGYLELFDVATGKVTPQAPRVPTDYPAARPVVRRLGGAVSSFTYDPMSDTALVEARGEMFALKADGDSQNISRTSGAREKYARFSPVGRQLAYLSDESGEWEIYLRREPGAEPVRLTDANGRITFTFISWSPDGKKIAAKTESNELYVVDVETRKMTQAFANVSIGASTDWSPDSRWIAAILRGPNELGAVHLYDHASGKRYRATEGFYDDSQVAFDKNGQYLYVQSVRTFNPRQGRYEYSLHVENADRLYAIPLSEDGAHPLASSAETLGNSTPKETKIDVEGMESRMVELPVPPGNYPIVLGGNGGVVYVAITPSGVVNRRFDLATRSIVDIYAGPTAGLAMTPSGDQLVIWGGGSVSVFNAAQAASAPLKKFPYGEIKALVNPQEEWRQMFYEAWRFQRDRFHDPAMRGLDWKAIRARYETLLPYVGHRNDLNYLVSSMYGELGTGHVRIMGGESGETPLTGGFGRLGADFEAHNSFVRFKKILRGENYIANRRGPLGAPGVRVSESEYLLAIDGQPVSVENPPAMRLMGKANALVTLTVNSRPTREGAREVRVRTIGSDKELRYATWVAENRKYIDRISGGRIGYMHLPDVGESGAAEFIRGFFSQTHKEAMLIDGRYNLGGGHQPWAEMLGRSEGLATQHRYDPPTTGRAIAGPKALLINEYAASSGETFPWHFRHARLGKIIGNRTQGATIGGNGIGLIDGGSIISATRSLFDPATGKNIAENYGIVPDIPVDARPDLVAAGKDPQLEAGIRHLMERLRATPPRKTPTGIPPRPRFERIGYEILRKG